MPVVLRFSLFFYTIERDLAAREDMGMSKLMEHQTPQEWRKIFSSGEFEREYYYDGNDLGAVYHADRTEFAVWAPTAQQVELLLYSAGSDAENGAGRLGGFPMEKGQKGVWRRTVEGNLAGIYYTYLVTADGQTRETADIYAKAAGVNGRRSMVADLKAAEPEGWEKEHDGLLWEEHPKSPVIWEVHVKDFSNDAHSGVPEEYRGKFKAFTCEKTGLDGDCAKPTCLSWLKKMGITHVHILPMYDYGSVEEAGNSQQFNWGYDPVNYNVPEGSYSTDPFCGETRIRECREMIQALHKAGIRVVMDVVYNHTYSGDSWFQRTVPYYYYRQNRDGSLSNGSACGNDTASERLMYRKYMVDSVLYWAREYHLDGFRFDLMGLHDVETMNAIRRALNTLPGGEKILMYGEPWAGGPTAMQEGNIQAVKANAALLDPGIAFFNDDTRDAVKGSVFLAKEPGYVNGKAGLADRIRSSVLAWCDGKGGYQPHSPMQVISYVSAHDNYTLWDKLLYTSYAHPYFYRKDPAALAQNRLAAGIYFTCLGIPFLQAGEEGARTKRGVGDSYNASARLNQLDWKRIYENRELADFYAGLIALRGEFEAYAHQDRDVLRRIQFLDTPEETVAFHFRDAVRTPVKDSALGEESETAGGAKRWTELTVIYRAAKEPAKIMLPEGKWQLITDGTKFKMNENGRLQSLREVTGNVNVAAVSVTILGR